MSQNIIIVVVIIIISLKCFSLQPRDIMTEDKKPGDASHLPLRDGDDCDDCDDDDCDYDDD